VPKTAKYSYVAKTDKGETRVGSLMADSETAAARRLSLLGVTPITINLTETGAKRSIGPKKRVKTRNLADYTRQLATMIAAGLPLVRALEALADQTSHPVIKDTTRLLRADVENGVSLSRAFSNHPKVFPRLVVTMTAAGEASGALADSLSRVADTFEKQAALQSKVLSALMYPAVVLGLAGVMLIAMLLFIVPVFVGIFETLGGGLPLPTQILVTLSGILRFGAPAFIVAAILGVIAWRKYKDKDEVRAIIDPQKLRLPIFGPFTKKIILARWSRVFSSLLDSGVPLIQAVEISANASGNIRYREALFRCRDGIRAGQSLSAVISREELFPPVVQQMVATGEDTGALPELLEKIATYYDTEVSRTAESLTSILEPLLLLFLGVVIGGLVISLYLPMFSVYDYVNA